jgi:abortive infection bacteriophage resistance protein
MRTRAGFLFYILKMQYNKLPLTFQDQIVLLEQRGLIIADKAKIENYLSHISYYRLRAYTYPYQNNNDSNHPFKTGITFEKILDDYIFDRKLRLILFDAIEKVEIALRTQLIYHYSLVHGSHWFEDISLFANHTYHQRDLAQVDKEINRSQEQFILHYQSKYSTPQRPPAWMTLEVLSFGTLSKLFENLNRCPEKKAIAKHFGLDIVIFESWLHHISVVRNICAHHARLWNREIPSAPKLPKRAHNAWLKDHTTLKANKIYSTICCLRYLLNVISPNNNFKIKLKDLLQSYPHINLRAMDFQTDWEEEYLWLL